MKLHNTTFLFDVLQLFANGTKTLSKQEIGKNNVNYEVVLNSTRIYIPII